MNALSAAATDPRQQLLSAAEKCFAKRGIQKTTMQEVADAAGVSRMTLYRYFEDRNALFRGMVLRNISRHWQLIGEALADVEDLEEWLVEATIFCLREVPKVYPNTLFLRLNSYSEGTRIALTDEGIAPAMEQIRPLYEKARQAGRVSETLTLALVVEWLYRMLYSLDTVPSPRIQTDDELRHVLRLWMARALV